MDLRLFGRVLWRFKRFVIGGFVFAILLATLSYAKPSLGSGGISLRYRSNELWASYTRLFVTQPGFNWGSSIVNPRRSKDATDQANILGVQSAGEARLSTLATIYANLVHSDEVLALMRKHGPVHGIVEAAPLPVAQGSDAVLPIISIAGIAPTKAESRMVSANAAESLRRFIARQQAAGDIRPSERIELQVINKAGGTKLYAPRKKTLPIVVFLTVMLAVVASAFILENLRPQLRAAAAEPQVTAAPAPQRVRKAPQRVRKTAS
jgi:hypothetical protein